MNTLNRFSDGPRPSDVRTRTAAILAVIEPLPTDKVAVFSQDLEQALSRLELQFAHFITQRSAIRSLGR